MQQQANNFKGISPMDIQFKQQNLILVGTIDFKNAETVYQQGLSLILQNKQDKIFADLSQLEHGNTLALAVFVQWLRHTPELNGLIFKAVPDKMLKIIQSCHLEKELQMVS